MPYIFLITFILGYSQLLCPIFLLANSEKQIFINPFLETNQFQQKKSIRSLKIKKKNYLVGKPFVLKFSYTYSDTFTGPNSSYKDQFKNRLLVSLKRISSGEIVWLKSTFAYRDRQNPYRYHCRVQIPPLQQSGKYKIIFHNQTIDKQFTFPSPISLEREKINILFLVDNSGSMKKNDPRQQRYSAIFDIAKDKILKKQLHSIAILGFNEFVKIILPFTPIEQVPHYKKKLKKNKNFTKGKTDIAKAFNKARQFLITENKKQKTILIFLTDGVSSFDYYDNHLKVAQMGIPIYTVGIYSGKRSAKYNQQFLKKISRDSKGYFFKGNNKLVKTLYQRIIKKSIKQIPQVDIIALKDKYYANESLVIKYHDSKNKKYRLEVINKDNHQKLSLLKKEPTTYFFNPLPKGRQRIVVMLKNKNKKILQKEYKIMVHEKHAPLIFESLLHFSEIAPYKITTKLYKFHNNFGNSMLMEWEYLGKETTNFILFAENPFWLDHKQKYIQTIRFLPGLFSIQQTIKDNQLTPLLLKTEQGVFVYQLSYDFISKGERKNLKADYLK